VNLSKLNLQGGESVQDHRETEFADEECLTLARMPSRIWISLGGGGADGQKKEKARFADERGDGRMVGSSGGSVQHHTEKVSLQD